MKKKTHLAIVLLLFLVTSGLSAQDRPAVADGGTAEDSLTVPFIDIAVRQAESNREVALSIQLILLLAVLTIAPSIVLLMTSFLRIAVVLDFVKRSLSLQQVPPTQVMMGIALFLTLFIMWPTISDIYDNAFMPFSAGEMDTQQMYDSAIGPLRLFMYRQLNGRHENIGLFMRMRGLPQPENFSQVPTYVLIPAYVLNELTIAFKIGILLHIPFICIDMVVASILMSMGMIMLPPIMISLPFKLIVFVLVDGWGLITQQIILSFR